MADNQEEVVYQFTGDVTSLRQATESALGLLNKYQDQINRISADGGFGKSTKAAKSFQSQINATTKQITNMQKQMKDVADVRLFPSSNVTQQLQSSIGSLNQVYDKLAASSKLSTKEVQALTSQLRSTNADLKSNAAGVTNLIQKEQQWQNTLDRVRTKTSQFRDGLDSLRTRVASVFDPMLAKLHSLSAPFAKVEAKLQTFRDKAAESFGRVSQLASTVASAFRRVSTAEGDSADATTKSINAHTRLRSVLSSIQNAFKKETSAIDEEETELTSKNRTLKDSVKKHSSLKSILASLGKMFASETTKISKFVANLKDVTSTSKLAKTALAGLTSIPISQWLTEAAKQSISYRENLNLFTVAMGDSLDVGNAFVKQMAEIYGMDPSNLMRYAGNFYQLADAIDMPDASAAKLSLSLLKATNDISSLFNVPIDKVFNDLSSGMQGMSRAVRKYGMDIRTTTLQQTALSLGITAQVEEMSEANRQGLRFITMMRQASNASGDFARTIESPANQLKIFKEQITQLGRAIGDLFIEPLAVVIRYINGFVMALRMIISFIGSVLGVVSNDTSDVTDITDDIAGGLDGIGDSAADATKKIKQMLAPFDELNILQDKTSSGSGADLGLEGVGTLDPAIAAEIERMELKLESIRMKALDVRDALLSFLGFKFEGGVILSWDASELEKNLIEKFPQWTQTIQATFANWSDIINAFGNVFKALAGIAQAVWEKVVNFFSKYVNDTTVAAYITNLADSLNNFANLLNSNQDAIANFVTTLGLLAAAFRGFSIIGPLIAPIASFIGTCLSAMGSLATMVGWVTAVVAAIAVLYVTSNSFATSFDNLMKAIVDGLGKVFNSFWDALQVVWTGIKKLWSKNIMPMITSIGDALAPVIDTVTALWNDFVDILVDAFDMVKGIWTSVLEPVLAAFFDAISNLARVFGTLWSEIIGPVVAHIGNGIKQLWTSALRPVFENIIGLIGRVATVILQLWNSVLAPVVSWLADVLAPVFTNVFKVVWNTVQAAISNISQSISGLLQILNGIIDFVTGVFTGDWKKAWQGVVSIFSGVWNTLAGVLRVPFNAVIAVINTVLGAISGAINSIIRAVNKISFKAPDWVPGVGGKTIGFNLKQVGTWSIPFLESGAVVTSPTLAMVGEGKYDEAVIPLGNSPQMKELVNQISDAVKGRGGSDMVHVNVYIGNEQVAEYMHRADKYNQLQTNGGI